MLKYIAKRIGLAIVTIWAVATITFFLMNMVPGGPFLSEKAISPQATAALEAKYGLDKPLFQQYLTYIGDALHGDLGDSLKQRGRTVMDIISTKFPVSARVGGISVLVALTLGIPLGCIAALKRGKFLDSLISVVATCGIAVPSFVICTVLLYFFGVKLGVLPTLGIGTWKHYIMPVMALSFYPTAYIMRLMRSSMLDVLGQDYMRTAKAKLAYTVTGSFVVEKIFTIPGLGGEFIRAINGRDYTLIMGTTIFLATLIIVMNVAVDIVYKIVDPRIKLK